MPTTDEVSDTLDMLAEYVVDIGDDVLIEGDPEIALRGETPQIGHRCQHGDHIYVIAAHEENRYVGLLYFVSIIKSISSQLDEDVSEVIVRQSEVVESNNTDEIADQAAKILLDEVPREEMSSFIRNLLIIMSGGATAATVNWNDQGTATDFHLERKIYPFEDSYEIDNFNTAVQSLINQGVRGTSWLNLSMDLLVDEDEPADTELRFNR